MKNLKSYNAQGEIRSGCLNKAIEWIAPNGEEIKIALSMAGWSGVEFSRKIGTNDRTVRRWLGNELPIPYAAWCILCIQANLGEIWK